MLTTVACVKDFDFSSDSQANFCLDLGTRVIEIPLQLMASPKRSFLRPFFNRVILKTTHGLDSNIPKFPHCVIYSCYRLDYDNQYMQKNLFVIFWISYAMLFEATF